VKSCAELRPVGDGDGGDDDHTQPVVSSTDATGRDASETRGVLNRADHTP